MTIDSKLERAERDIPPEAGEPPSGPRHREFFFLQLLQFVTGGVVRQSLIRAGMPISSEQSRLGLRQVAIGGGVLVTGSPALVVSRISS